MLGARNAEAVLRHEYVYDIGAGDSGAVGVVDLSAKERQVPLPLGAVRMATTGTVLTAFVGGGASLQYGDGTNSDADRAATAVAALGLNVVLADSAERVASDAALSQVVVEVTGAPLTAGKLSLQVEYYLPKS